MSEESNQRTTADRVKVLEEKVDSMRRDFEYGPAVQAAFQAGESAGAEPESRFLPRKGFGMLQLQRSSTGLTEDCIEALMANLTALDGLGAGDLAQRLDKTEERLEALAVAVAQAVQLSREGLELLRYVLSGERQESRSTLDAAAPQPPQDVPPSMPSTPTAFLPKYLSDPPMALTAVMEEATASTGSSRRRLQSAASAAGDESITAAELDADANVKFIEVPLQRSAAQPSWGLLWDRKCFDKKRRVIEAIVPQSPAGVWNQERSEKGEDHLQRGDELVKLNGKLGWEACSDLTNLQNVQLLFRRPTDQERFSKGRRNSKQFGRDHGITTAQRPYTPAEAAVPLTDSQRMRASAEAKGKSRQPLSSASSPSRATATGGSLNSMPHTPSTGPRPASPEQLLQRTPPVKSQDSDPQNTIQVLQAALTGGGPAQKDPRGATQTPLQPPQQPPPSQRPQGVSPMVATIMSHSRSVRAADPNKASLINPPAEELHRLAGHLLAGEAGSAMSLVLTLLQKSVPGPDGRSMLVAVEQTEAAQYLLDLLTLLDAQQAPAAK